MSHRILGLDVGSSSLGWALIDEEDRKVVAAGVRVFPEGVDRDQQGGEQSKSQTRRIARGTRRQIRRRARRRQALRSLLQSAGLLPATPDALEEVLCLNPYPLRRRALHEALSPYEIGRVLLHLNQRRGFQSNRKADKARASETKGMLAEIGELESKIREAGCGTLGEYLARLHEQHEATEADGVGAVRGRHTKRDMYREELDQVWSAQEAHHPTILTTELKAKVADIVFFQRKMYWPKSVIGTCDLERGQKRCPKADRRAQRFRMLQEVNNLRLLDRSSGEERSLTEEERQRLLSYLVEGKERTFDQIRRKLGLLENVQFNFERGERSKLLGHVTDALLSSKKGIGRRWREIPEAQKDGIIRILLDEADEAAALTWLQYAGLTPEEAQRAAALHLPAGYMNFSRRAIERLLPHLERGLPLMKDDATNSALHAAGYLRPDEREIGQRRFLPKAPDLPNPIVRQALVEVRKVVNGIVRTHGRPDAIHVELARETKKSFDERREIRFENARRRKLREAAAQEIEERGYNPTRATQNRVLLWREQGERCPYCGDPISQAQLFNGEADVDHILPRWRSLDDSLANKVVAHRGCNMDKGQQTPREWLEDRDPDRYARMLQTIRILPYNKQRKFQEREIRLDDFVERQLRDTAYISRCVTQYLRCLGAEIVCPRGQMTADLRHWWGLNTILDPEGRGVKNRAHHCHHAIDAAVLALTNRSRLFALANARGENMPLPWPSVREDIGEIVANIKISHRVQRRIRGALHEATIYGATQKRPDAPAGDNGGNRPWAKAWVEQRNVYVRRKPIEALTNTKHIEKVRDPAIREILKNHLRDRIGIDPEAARKIPGTAFKGENVPRMPSGVPIRRVRMLEESETFRPVSQRRPGQYVKPGSNHHIVYRARNNGDETRWSAEVVSMWDAARRVRSRADGPLAMVDRSDSPEGEFVMSLSMGEMFEIDSDHGERLLCVVRKIDQRSKRVHYKLHTDARQADLINAENLYLTAENLRRLNARKVTVDTIGRIRYAND